MNEITIKALSPDLEKDYFDFFDNRAFSDGSPYYPCYCNAFNMSAGEIEAMRDQAKQYGGGIEGWKRSLRETAVRMVRQGLIRGVTDRLIQIIRILLREDRKRRKSSLRLNLPSVRLVHRISSLCLRSRAWCAATAIISTSRRLLRS